MAGTLRGARWALVISAVAYCLGVPFLRALGMPALVFLVGMPALLVMLMSAVLCLVLQTASRLRQGRSSGRSPP